MAIPSRLGFGSALWAALAALVLAGCGVAPRAPSLDMAQVISGNTPSASLPAPFADSALPSISHTEPAAPPVDEREPAVPAEPKPLPQVGIASWYGTPFHGRKTASGERYDMHAMTAAHPTLPLRSYVLVRHVGNQREVVLRVNDRGPFKWGRIIDLSRAAARWLGIAGLAHVEVWAIGADDPRVLASKAPPARREARHVPARAGKTVVARTHRAPDGPTRRSSVSASEGRRSARSG
ncbi:MAG: septal ring lytic transglycosylase RlpA family protein [Burkholderiaceae bacterium]